MFDAIVFDAVRVAREYLTAHVTAKAAEVVAAVAAAGGGIKSVQRGTGYSGTATISAVDLAKSFIVVSAGEARITSATTVQMISPSLAAWEVVEFK